MRLTYSQCESECTVSATIEDESTVSLGDGGVREVRVNGGREEGRQPRGEGQEVTYRGGEGGCTDLVVRKSFVLRFRNVSSRARRQDVKKTDDVISSKPQI